MESWLEPVEPVASVIGGGIESLSGPLWIPWPLPVGWTFCGLAHGGRDTAVDAEATVSCWSGEDPFGDPIEALFVSEEAGSGVGSHFAGLPISYPTPGVGVGAPDARIVVHGRIVSLWAIEAVHDRAVYAGEAAGRWLWVILHPAEASAVIVSPPPLVDARTLGAELALLPLGELSPRLLLV
jgi:hypothetical protein